jgi:hypothetical protein
VFDGEDALPRFGEVILPPAIQDEFELALLRESTQRYYLFTGMTREDVRKPFVRQFLITRFLSMPPAQLRLESSLFGPREANGFQSLMNTNARLRRHFQQQVMNTK